MIKAKMISDQKYEFLPNDFELRGTAKEDLVDKNFASQSFWKDAMKRFLANKGAVFGLIVIAIIVIFALIGPIMNPHTYDSQIIEFQNLAPRIPLIENLGILDGSEGAGLTKVNKYFEMGLSDTFYWFGTDTLGRDQWTRTWTGARISLFIAVVAVAIDMIVGMSYGLISGYFGGKIDNIMQRIAEVINGIPTLVIVTLLLIVLKPGLGTICLALMITGWISMARIARAQMMKLKEQEFVLASRTLGANDKFIIFKEILPNIIGQLITNTMFSIPNAIFTEAFLSFVGLGMPAPLASLGSLISDGYKTFTTHTFQIIPPVIVLALLMLCFNMLADGLRDALDPKMKEQ